ncbi:HAD family hydrolase [Paludibacterium paludis]|uniref:Haloacid dehalogenase n=1 Tax=Paludibacterium paludis TaxID=1225769 RepID=A0A918P2A2_9NEIS|nr:HAD family phosphatase [Paludibacterium paludis]GGY11834.1 haloacid dehalogenase [Paludibacterium paludis]
MNVVFDLGGVLFDWNPEHRLAQFFADEALRERVRETVYRHGDWVALDRGVLTERQAIARFAERSGLPEVEIEGLLWATRLGMTPLDTSWALLFDLHGRGVPLYVVSNMSRRTFAFLRAHYPHWELFQGILVSGHLGLMKPDTAIYRQLIRQYGLSAADTVMIDDLEPNVIGARRAGMRAILFSSAESCRRRLAELTGE